MIERIGTVLYRWVLGTTRSFGRQQALLPRKDRGVCSQIWLPSMGLLATAAALVAPFNDAGIAYRSQVDRSQDALVARFLVFTNTRPLRSNNNRSMI
jgi:hypothetical protein